MRDNAAFLVGRDDQRRQVGRGPPGLQCGDFRLQGVYAAASEIVPGDIDTGNQPLLRQRRHLVERRVADNEMPAELVRRGSVSVKYIVLPPFEAQMRRQHR